MQYSHSRLLPGLLLALALISCPSSEPIESPIDASANGRTQLLKGPFPAAARRLLEDFEGLGEAQSQIVYEIDMGVVEAPEVPAGWLMFERKDIGGYSLVRVLEGGPGSLEVVVKVEEGPAHVLVSRLPVASGRIPRDPGALREWILGQFGKGDIRDKSVGADDVEEPLRAQLPEIPDFREPLSSSVLISLDFKPGSTRFGKVILQRVPSFEVQYQSSVYGAPEFSAGPVRGRVNLAGDHRDALVLPVGEKLTTSVAVAPGRVRLDFALGALVGVKPGELTTLLVNVKLITEDGSVHSLPQISLDPRGSAADRTWRDISVDLAKLVPGGLSGSVDISFSATDPNQTERELAVAIAHPRLVGGVSKQVRPNLILVSLDTMRADRVGVIRTDGEPSKTPHLDAFSKEALVFTAAESTAPFTLPSHGSVFTGRMPSTHGGVDMQTPLRSGVPLVTEILASAGWSTTAFTGGGFLSPDFGFSRGFDRYTVHDPLITTETLPAPMAAVVGDALDSLETGDYEDSLRLNSAWGLKHAAVTNFLMSAAESPYFAFVHTYAAHQYHPPEEIYKRELEGTQSELTFGKHLGPISPERWRNSPPTEADKQHMRRLYDACVVHADEEFGAVIEGLRATGGLENTYVVVFSDHGEELFEHGELGHSDSLRESLLHVPLLIAGPGIEPGRIDDPVSLIDLAPTLFELLGLPSTDLFEGSPLVEFDGASFQPRLESTAVFSEVSHHEIYRDSLRAGKWKLVRDYGPDGRDGATPVDRLYNLGEDSTESMDRAADEAVLLGRLVERLESYRERLDAESAGLPSDAADLSAGTLEALGHLGYL